KEMVQPSNNDSSSTETTNHSSITTSKLTQDLLSGSSSSISSSETTAYAESHISEHHRPSMHSASPSSPKSTSGSISASSSEIYASSTSSSSVFSPMSNIESESTESWRYVGGVRKIASAAAAKARSEHDRLISEEARRRVRLQKEELKREAAELNSTFTDGSSYGRVSKNHHTLSTSTPAAFSPTLANMDLFPRLSLSLYSSALSSLLSSLLAEGSGIRREMEGGKRRMENSWCVRVRIWVGVNTGIGLAMLDEESDVKIESGGGAGSGKGEATIIRSRRGSIKSRGMTREKRVGSSNLSVLGLSNPHVSPEMLQLKLPPPPSSPASPLFPYFSSSNPAATPLRIVQNLLKREAKKWKRITRLMSVSAYNKDIRESILHEGWFVEVLSTFSQYLCSFPSASLLSLCVCECVCTCLCVLCISNET
ncbi:hypothetical protein ADUPG1_000693, partial [Aduncisulcus paluster]